MSKVRLDASFVAEGKLQTYPSVNLALIPTSLGCNVILQDFGQCGSIGDVADPAGELRMPA